MPPMWVVRTTVDSKPLTWKFIIQPRAYKQHGDYQAEPRDFTKGRNTQCFREECKFLDNTFDS